MSSEEPKPFLSGVMGASVVVSLTFIVVAGGFVGLLVQGASHHDEPHGEAPHGEAPHGEAPAAAAATH